MKNTLHFICVDFDINKWQQYGYLTRKFIPSPHSPEYITASIPLTLSMWHAIHHAGCFVTTCLPCT